MFPVITDSRNYGTLDTFVASKEQSHSHKETKMANTRNQRSTSTTSRKIGDCEQSTILFLFGCSEMNASQRAWKGLVTCVLY